MSDSLTDTTGTGNQTPEPSPGAPTPAPQDQIDYKQKFAESTRGAQQLYQENLKLRQFIQEQQQRQQEPPPVPKPKKRLLDAVIDADQEGIDAALIEVEERAEQRVLNRLLEVGTASQRKQSLNQFFQDNKELNDPNSGLYKLAISKYNDILAGRRPDLAAIDTGTEDFQGYPVARNVLVAAVTEAKAELKGGGESAPYVESHGRDHTPPGGGSRRTGMILSEVEKEHIGRLAKHDGKPLAEAEKKYWDSLSEGEKENRRRFGPPAHG